VAALGEREPAGEFLGPGADDGVVGFLAQAGGGVRFMRATPRDERAMDGESGSVEDGPENDTEGL
jgi:hypothetical protein